MTEQQPYDPKCKRYAADIPEVVMWAEAEEMTPEDFAREDGTYNPENGHFLCTECYIAAGMPSSPYGWKCP